MVLGAFGVVLLAIAGVSIEPASCAPYSSNGLGPPLGPLFLIAVGGPCVAFGACLAWLDHRRSRGLERGALDSIGVPAAAVLVAVASMYGVPAAFHALGAALNLFSCF